MSAPVDMREARIGDLVEVVGHRVGDAARAGEIVGVLEGAVRPYFRVAWEDGRTSVLFPGPDIRVLRAQRDAA